MIVCYDVYGLTENDLRLSCSLITNETFGNKNPTHLTII